MSTAFSKKQILALFAALDKQLHHDDVIGEIFMVGGAVMCLVMGARETTADVDAIFRPASAVRQAAARVAAQHGVETSWLNDAVKGYLSENANFSVYLQMENLRVMAAEPETLLAMKCLAMRIGEGYHDVHDILFLLRALNMQNFAEICAAIAKYYPIERFPPKTLYALQELLASTATWKP